MVIPFLAIGLIMLLSVPFAQAAQSVEKQTIKVHVLVTKTKAEAEEVLTLLRQGVPFVRLVRERSIGPNKDQGGDMGYIDPEQVSLRVKQVLKGLGEGEYSPILQTELGYTIFYHTTDRYYEAGKTYFQEGKYPQAVEALEQDMRLNPERTEALFLLGIIYESRGLFDQALPLFQQVVEIDPTFVLAYNALGALYEKKGDVSKAETMYTKAITLNPEYYEAHNNLANIYARTGREQEAIAEYNKAINLNTEAAPVYDNLARLYGTMHLKLPEAIMLAKRAILLDPQEASYRETLAQLYARTGEYALAVTEMRKALDLAPQNEQYRQEFKQFEELRSSQGTARFAPSRLTSQQRTLHSRGDLTTKLAEGNRSPSLSRKPKQREETTTPSAVLEKLEELEQEVLTLKTQIEKLTHLEEELVQRKAAEKELYALLARSEAERTALEEKVTQLLSERNASPPPFFSANGKEEGERVDMFFLAWAPDGKAYAVQKHFADRDELWIHQFMMDQKMRIAEGQWGTRSIAGLPAPTLDFHWFADTHSYLFTTPLGKSSIIYLGGDHGILNLSLLVQDQEPEATWAPNQTKFLYVQGGDLFLKDLTNDRTVQGPLTQSLGDIACPAWSPTGTDIAFSAEHRGHFDIYLYAPRHEKETVISRLTHLSSQTPLCPSWSPSGKALAFYATLPQEKGWGLYTISLLAELSPRVVAEDVVVPREGPVWVDEDHLLYVGERAGGGRGIYQLDLRLGDQILLLQEQDNLSPLLHWSAANHMVAYQLSTPKGMRMQFLPLGTLQSEKR